ncbi:hypothetical protein U9M48_007518 [Paspalum notatum var. saurae]|uniref:Uncharacterized protein n=1 Tax=Paspalum notatum var. saurae TaxID=547442 RepID=A0AAQ3Q1L6_PASNO
MQSPSLALARIAVPAQVYGVSAHSHGAASQRWPTGDHGAGAATPVAPRATASVLPYLHVSAYASEGSPLSGGVRGWAALEVDGVAGGGYKRALAATCSSATRLTTRGELDDGRAQPFGVSSMRVGHRELLRGGPSLPPASSMWMHL